jgi:hypothetical protein
MPIIQPVHEVEAKSATVKVSDDGRSAVIAFAAPAPGAHYRVKMSRRLLDRLVLQIAREQARLPRPARPQSSARESI